MVLCGAASDSFVRRWRNSRHGFVFGKCIFLLQEVFALHILSVIIVLSCPFVQLDLVSPFSLYFNINLVFSKLQIWRLFTNFFFFGALSVDFLFHMFFLARYCRLLEEGSFRGRTSDFALMLLFGGGLMCFASAFVSVPPFLGSSLAFMMVYVWARRNDDVRMSFLGLFNFR